MCVAGGPLEVLIAVDSTAIGVAVCHSITLRCGARRQERLKFPREEMNLVNGPAYRGIGRMSAVGVGGSKCTVILLPFSSCMPTRGDLSSV